MEKITLERIYDSSLNEEFVKLNDDAFSVDDLCLHNGGFCDEIYKCNYDSFETEYELNNGSKQFKIDELEVYEVKFI